MLDIKFDIIKQYCKENNIKSLKQYHEAYRNKILPINFPYTIINYLKKHDPLGFISTNELFPEAKSLRIKTKIKPPKKVKIKKPKKLRYQKKLNNRYSFYELLPIVRALGLTSSQEWRIYCKNNKNNWNYRIPKTPEKYYKNEWVSWTHFLISDNIPKNMSHGEREIFRILNYENISFEMNKSFPDLSNGKLSYDFYIPSRNTLIEYDGIYHYQNIKGKNLNRQILNDDLKNIYAFTNNIKLIRIPYTEHNNIPKILYNNNLCSFEDFKLLRRSYKINNINSFYKSNRFKLCSQKFNWNDIKKIRELYLKGLKRNEINKQLNLNISRYSFSDMVRNKTYYDSSYNPPIKNYKTNFQN